MAIVRIVRIASAVASTLTLAAIAACSGNSDPSTFGGSSDAGTDTAEPNFDSGTFTQGDAADGSAINCAPVDDGTFTPEWKAPAPFAQGKCSDTQIDGFYTACLTPPVDPAACSAFTTANADCASCIQSDDTSANQGPVIWHLSRSYYTMNTPGCIANAQQDSSATSCGATLQATLQCAQAECSACFTPSSGDFAKFQACESSANQGGCKTYSSKISAACAAAHADAAAPVTACFSVKGEDTRVFYKRMVPLFCGGATQ